MSKIIPAGTHIPLLIKAFEKTISFVLELGSGYNSTFLLYHLCKASGRNFKSYDNDKAWIEKMEGITEYVEDWDRLDLKEKWSLVLIDNRPAVTRKDLALKLKDQAFIILLHDSEPEIDKFYGYSKIYKHFKYVYHYTKLKPHTVALSNFLDVETLLT